ncbi:hypothetical protein PVL29_013622 [Vitis rotundifolia]|uniref:Secreted protein n=1 Tax=Vitis rotundifolia TaxID=103349 RepID=A0AA39DQ02_VITRO|nr:hypothetical protein PVL29_013622 [Vitis rotundifolia]
MTRWLQLARRWLILAAATRLVAGAVRAGCRLVAGAVCAGGAAGWVRLQAGGAAGRRRSWWRCGGAPAAAAMADCKHARGGESPSWKEKKLGLGLGL